MDQSVPKLTKLASITSQIKQHKDRAGRSSRKKSKPALGKRKRESSSKVKDSPIQIVIDN